MSDIKIYPSKLSGRIKAPPSKSVAHRAIICASLSFGISRIKNIDLSKDIIATIEAMRNLGAVIKICDEDKEYKELIIDGSNIFKNKKISSGDEYKKDVLSIYCNESGSTIRFLIPLALHYHGECRFLGEGNLNYRPQEPYFHIFKEKKIQYKVEEKNKYLPLRISGKETFGDFTLQGNISSQFISGLLFSLPLMRGDSRIILKTPLESKGYIDLTLQVLEDFGITIENENYMIFNIKGNQKYTPRDYIVEGDYSQGAFFIVANALGNNVEVTGLKEKSYQGDKEILDIIRFIDENRLWDRKNQIKEIVSRDIHKKAICYLSEDNTFIIDGRDIPDIVPITSVLCSFLKVNTRIINAERLRIKESDRLKSITVTMNSIGGDIKELPQGLFINPIKDLKGGEVEGFNDHRIVMSMAIASTMCKRPLIIKGYRAIEKSYPNFFKDFKRLNGRLEYK